MSEYSIPEDIKQRFVGSTFPAAYPKLIDALAERIAKQDAEIERLNKMRTHCENCGADYMATGIEAGCSCKLAAENTSLKEQVERLSAWQTSVLRRRGLSDAPCDVCGYNGVGYYQPSTHPCASRAAKEKP